MGDVSRDSNDGRTEAASGMFSSMVSPTYDLVVNRAKPSFYGRLHDWQGSLRKWQETRNLYDGARLLATHAAHACWQHMPTSTKT